MEALQVSPYWLTRFCFQRGLGFIYLMAFLIALNQARPLIGENGLLPAQLFLNRIKFWDSPSLFWLHFSDKALLWAASAGVCLSLLAVSGLSDRFGLTFSVFVWASLWLLQLSFVNAGQTFWGFGWETLLLEAGFLAIFLGSANTTPPVIVIWMLRWVLLRLMFGAGLIKLRADPCWKDLSCMFYHYETQPVPNPLSPFFHRLPQWFHKLEVLFTHFVELAVPFGFLVGRSICAVAGLITIVFQAVLILSGNLSWLNYITIVVAIACFNDAWLGKIIPIAPPATPPIGFPRQIVLGALAALVAALSIRPTINLFSRRQAMNASFEPLHLVNTYGAFGSVTRTRYEIVFEGTDDPVVTAATRWKPYEFKGKPGNIYRRPALMSPYHWRLDWQMWFAAMNDYRYHPWILNLAAKMLQNHKPAMKLLAHNPFPDHPPTFVRALLYEYHFAESRRGRGPWWSRTLEREYLPPLSLRDKNFCEILRRQGWMD